ncbi:MAG TPA: cupin domain-containing protein [Candidatus Cloacimonadota bacterium]|nr:cupin domain-containing protein [Candidatus Cloacimonadota bacterium]
MKHAHYTEIPLEDVTMEGARKAKIRWLVSSKDGAPNFAMRLFEIGPGGFTPYHAHAWEHENFIVEGEGLLTTEEAEIPFKEGDIVYVEPNLKHNYVNTGKTVLKFLCMVPNETPKQTEKKTINPFAGGVANNC